MLSLSPRAHPWPLQGNLQLAPRWGCRLGTSSSVPGVPGSPGLSLSRSPRGFQGSEVRRAVSHGEGTASSLWERLFGLRWSAVMVGGAT